MGIQHYPAYYFIYKGVQHYPFLGGNQVQKINLRVISIYNVIAIKKNQFF